LTKVSKPITGFSYGAVNDTAKNSLPISFNILEKSDGAALQIIYAGNPDATVNMKGTIVGAGSPRLLRPGENRFTAVPTTKSRLRVNKLAAYFAIGAGFLAAVVGSVLTVRRRKAGLPIRASAIGLLGAGVMHFLMGAFLLYSAYKAEFPGVPPTIWTET
jgi:hypothetical protein